MPGAYAWLIRGSYVELDIHAHVCCVCIARAYTYATYAAAYAYATYAYAAYTYATYAAAYAYATYAYATYVDVDTIPHDIGRKTMA